jgi:hypothetical protein
MENGYEWGCKRGAKNECNPFPKWISEKQMPSHRMGRLWKFRKEEVDEWVKTGGADDSRIDDSGKPACRDATRRSQG